MKIPIDKFLVINVDKKRYMWYTYASTFERMYNLRKGEE